MTLTKLKATSKATECSSEACLGITRIFWSSLCFPRSEDRGTEGVLVIEDALLVLVVGVLIAHAVFIVIRVVLTPIEVVLIGLCILVE